MASFHLRPGESLIGHGLVSYRDLENHTFACWRAGIYVTNQRVFLDTYTEIELKLSKISGFSTGKLLFLIPTVTIYGQTEENAYGHGLAEEGYAFTGFPVKHLPDWLRRAGVRAR